MGEDHDLSERTADQLERAWDERAREPRGPAAVRLIVVRLGGGRHACPERALLSLEGGVEGDRWASAARPDPLRQVTIMDVRVAELVAAGRATLDAAGDNLLIDLDLAEAGLPVGARLGIGGTVLEVTAAPHNGCKLFRERFGAGALAWINQDGTRRLRGANCRVVSPGSVTIGDLVVRLA